MVVSIIGWYGTETMGDRAILDGILSILSEYSKHITVQIGSLFDFYTRRTLMEEKDVFNKTAPLTKLKIFDIKDKKVREEKIKCSDVLLFGGGPLMDLEELFLIKKCFIYAKQCKIPTVIMGCGMGPLKRTDYISVVYDILSMASKISFRDMMSLKLAKEMYGENENTICLGDPAVISVENYKKGNKYKKAANIVVNFRDYPQHEYGAKSNFRIEDMRKLLTELEKVDMEVMLVPMHTFGIGGDDRFFLSELVYNQQYRHVKVIHRPLNLKELYQIYTNAYGCIGMRYHAVVMQTILNGNNVIIDYTDPNTGKIKGFLDDVDNNGFYKERIFNIQKEQHVNIDHYVAILKEQQHFVYQYTTMKEKYVDFLADYFG